jgi:hypothetical protein
MMSRRSDNGRVQQLYQIADNAAAAVINGGTASLVQAQGGKSGFEALWFNFDQRKFSVTNTEMLWHIAEYGATTNSALESTQWKGLVEELMDPEKHYNLYYQVITCLLIPVIRVEMFLYLLQYLFLKCRCCNRYLGKCRDNIFMYHVG